MKTKNQFCANCYFFMQTGHRGQDEKIGYCRAEPPKPHYTNGLKTDEGESIPKPQIARFPIVLGSMWCGMYDETDD